MATTISLSEDVAEKLERLKKKLGLKSLNDVVTYLTREDRVSALNRAFGIDKGKVKRFSEEDRIEDRR